MFKKISLSPLKSVNERLKGKEICVSSTGIGIAFPCSHHNFVELTKAADREVQLLTLRRDTNSKVHTYHLTVVNFDFIGCLKHSCFCNSVLD